VKQNCFVQKIDELDRIAAEDKQVHRTRPSEERKKKKKEKKRKEKKNKKDKDKRRSKRRRRKAPPSHLNQSRPKEQSCVQLESEAQKLALKRRKEQSDQLAKLQS